jgi:hypothetical protein
MAVAFCTPLTAEHCADRVAPKSIDWAGGSSAIRGIITEMGLIAPLSSASVAATIGRRATASPL